MQIVSEKYNTYSTKVKCKTIVGKKDSHYNVVFSSFMINLYFVFIIEAAREYTSEVGCL